MELINKVLKNWGIQSSEILHKYDVSGGRVVYKICTENGYIILKGIPINVQEKIIVGNTRAHEYLGNKKGIAPKIIYLPNGDTYLKAERYYFYLMEFILGRQLEETEEDEFLLGQATAKLHQLNDLDESFPSINTEQQKKIFHTWFSEHSFKKEYDAILNSLPNFNHYDQCFIHTDIGPHNARLNTEGKVIFIDLDDSGLGSRYIDFGYPFIMQFVDYNKKTCEIKYRYDLAKAFLKGYYGDKNITKDEFNMIWNGAIFMHISYMQVFGPDAVEPLWKILKFGIEQKEQMYEIYKQ